MLGNMADPKAIGPAMAVALLTTLYGAFIANILFAPMVTKLEGYTAYEIVYREMVVEGLRNTARGESPRNIQDQLLSNLPPKMQESWPRLDLDQRLCRYHRWPDGTERKP